MKDFRILGAVKHIQRNDTGHILQDSHETYRYHFVLQHNYYDVMEAANSHNADMTDTVELGR